jgi:hypothetical protein
MFFEPRRRAFELTAQRVLALRPSLNTPVVAASDLPVGPACAAILVHVEPGHGLQISVGVRSLGCGSVTVFGFDGPIGASVVNVALDAALSFAESMGFLFDDDMVDDDAGSQEKAVLRWQEMIGDVPSGPSADRPRATALDLFDAEAGELTDPPVPLEEEPRPAAPLAPAQFQPERIGEAALELQPPHPENAVALTKFRVEPSAEPAPQPSESAAGRALQEASRRALGRMRLVKRPGTQQVQDARRAWLLRLLTSF